MRRVEIQNRVQTLILDLRQRIERDPIRSFLIGIVIGMVLVLFSRVLLPLVCVLAIVAGLLWFFSEEDQIVR